MMNVRILQNERCASPESIGRFNTLSIQLLYMINVDEEGELEMLSTCTTINCILSRFHEKYSL